MFNKNINLYFFVLASFILSLTQLCEAASDPIDEFKIRSGVNVSHWLSQSDKRGEERKQYIVKADFDTIAFAGFDHVRIPLDEVQLWDSSGNKHTEAFELLHNAINWAFEANLRVIADLHIVRSHYFNAESNALWTDPAEQEKLVDMWRQLSAELSKYPNSNLAYEVLNEAAADDPEDWNKVVNKVISDIRTREPERIIVLGSNRWQTAGTFPQLRVPENDRNIILSFHFYSPMALTHHQAPWTSIADYSGPVNYPGWIVDTSYYSGMSMSTAKAMRDGSNGFYNKEMLLEIMMPAIKVAKEKNLPLYCGEYGVYPTIPDEVRFRWYKDMCEIFNANNISYTHWGYKGDFPVVGEHSIPDRRLTDILTGK